MVEYDISDGYTYSNTISECVEYESAEAFYIHLEEKIKQYMAEMDQYQQELQVRREDFHQLNRRLKRTDVVVKAQSLRHKSVIEKQEKDRTEIKEQLSQINFPQLPKEKIILGGKEWELSLFCNTGTKEITMPEVLELEEWFKRNVS